MFLTDIIKTNKIRSFIDANFRKENVVFNSINYPKDANSSLNGLCFETIFKVVSDKNSNLQITLKDEILNGMSNRRSVLKGNDFSIRNSKIIHTVENGHYKLITSGLSKVKKDGKFKLKYLKTPFRVIEIEVINSLDRFLITEKLKLPHVYSKENITCLQIINSEHLSRYMEKTEADFLHNSLKIRSSNKIGLNQVRNLYEFTHFSSLFFKVSAPLVDYSTNKEFYKHFCKQFNSLTRIQLNEPIFYKPSLKFKDIWATPDIISNSVVYELKSGKECFVKSDFYQSICYLLLSQALPNIKKYGKISSAKIIYLNYDTVIDLNIKKLGITNRKCLDFFKVIANI